MDNNYWIDFWKSYTTSAIGKDEQSQVLRTLNKVPISKELWEYTLTKIDEVFNIIEGDHVLDLCSGNGLISKHFVDKGASVVAVDISIELLKSISNIHRIKTINSDIRSLDFEVNSFDKIILYAGIQYLSFKEAILLLKNIFKWLKPNGIVMIGDIPDFNRRWDFFNTNERQEVFYDNQLTGKSIIGNWFEIEWFDYLTNYLGFNEGKFIKQDKKLINANHRFDYFYKK